MTGGDSALSSLPADFHEGLEALEEAAEERNPPADANVRVVDRDGTNVIVRLGVWPTERYRRAGVDFEADEYVVYARVPERFPTGSGKGFVTAPPLKRRDRDDLANNPWQPSLAQTVTNETGENAESYSHNWENASMNAPEDMVKFLDVADEFLSRG